MNKEMMLVHPFLSNYYHHHYPPPRIMQWSTPTIPAASGDPS
jgi:hypothetical protein